jgi:hypothetical protein
MNPRDPHEKLATDENSRDHKGIEIEPRYCEVRKGPVCGRETREVVDVAEAIFP